MKSISQMSLAELAAFVSSHLASDEIHCVVTGGACVSIYSSNKYQSFDLDFIENVATDRSSVPGPTAPALKWTCDPGEETWNNASPIVGRDRTIYLPSRGGNGFYAINPDGTLKWRYEHPNSEHIGIEAAPAVDDNANAYVIINTVGLVALDSLGTVKWISNDLGDYGWPTPTIGPDGTIYVAGKYWANHAIRFMIATPLALDNGFLQTDIKYTLISCYGSVECIKIDNHI